MSSEDVKRWLRNLADERDGAALYDQIAAAESDGKLAEVYRRLADVERRHADVWERKLTEVGVEIPRVRISWRTKVLGLLARRFGASLVLPSVQALEQADSSKYAGQSDAGALDADERSHGRVLRAMARIPGGVGGRDVAKLEGRHRTAGGNALRAAVLGANDGLVSNLSLVMGVAGAEMSGRTILITGLAGLLAGAGSMALGEWLSVKSSRELYEHQIETEREELLEAPQEEQAELALIYQSRGLSEDDAKRLAASVMSEHESALETLVREELGIDPEELGGSAWEAAVTSFALFAVGAIIPVIPFFFLGGQSAVGTSIALSALGLFVIGASVTLFTGKPVVSSGLRQVLFGLVAAGLVWVIGRLVGVSIAG